MIEIRDLEFRYWESDFRLRVPALCVETSERVAVIGPSAWIHALTMGALSSLIMAMMMRSTLGHTGRALVASRMDVAAFLALGVLLWYAAQTPTPAPGASDSDDASVKGPVAPKPEPAPLVPLAAAAEPAKAASPDVAREYACATTS